MTARVGDKTANFLIDVREVYSVSIELLQSLTSRRIAVQGARGHIAYFLWTNPLTTDIGQGTVLHSL